MLINFGQLLCIDEQLLLHFAAWISIEVSLLQLFIVFQVEDKIEKPTSAHDWLVHSIRFCGEGKQLFGCLVDSVETHNKETTLSFSVFEIVLLAEHAKLINRFGHLVLNKLEHVIEIGQRN